MSSPNLNFSRAQYGGPAAPLTHCTWCGRGIDEDWFEANGTLICPICAANARAAIPAATRRTFWRAAGWGAAAAAGLALALAVAEHLLMIAGAGFGYVLIAIPVGMYIARAMRKASGGVGGRKYQVAAALLTYIAVSIGSLAALTWGADQLPLWTYALMPLFPIVAIFTGHTSIAGITLLAAFVGIRWAWAPLAVHPLRITGPFRRS